MGEITKGPAGVEDLSLKDSGITRQTFTRLDSEGRTITLNKIDAEDMQLRTLERSIDDALVIHIDSIADLRLISGDHIVDLLGYSSPGDGGGGQFYWDSTSTETEGTLSNTSEAVPPFTVISFPTLYIFLSSRISTVLFSAIISISSKVSALNSRIIVPKFVFSFRILFLKDLVLNEINSTEIS